MLEKEIERLYLRFRLLHYRNVFENVREKSGSLSATEAFSAEVIYLLDRPTVKEFADFLDISQSNATYKINSLIGKGYIVKRPSPDDRRESRLEVTDKFLGYYGMNSGFMSSMMKNIREKFSTEECAQLEQLVKKILTEALD